MGEVFEHGVVSAGSVGVVAWLLLGLAVAYRGSRVVNLAQGPLLVVAALAFDDLRQDRQLEARPAATMVVAGTAALCLATHLVVVRPLRQRSTAVRSLATLPVAVFVSALIVPRFEPLATGAPISSGEGASFLGVSMSRDEWLAVWLAAVAAAVCCAVYRFTRFGLATAGAAENPPAARALGWSADLLRAASWAVAGGLAGVGGVLIGSAPLEGAEPGLVGVGLVVGAAALRSSYTRLPVRGRAERIGRWARRRRAGNEAGQVEPLRLELKALTVRFGGVTAAEDVSLVVEPGEIVGLIGPNGAGKSTIVDSIMGDVDLTAGEISLGTRRIDRLSARRRVRAGLNRTFQTLELPDDRTVLENLSLGRTRSGALSSTAQLAIQELALADDLQRAALDLPCGRRRLVAAARAAASRPSVLLLDEAASGLDDLEASRLARFVHKLAKDHGMGVLVVEHDLGFVVDACDRVVVLDLGRTVAAGAPRTIGIDPVVVAAYLGVDAEVPAPDSAAPEPVPA